MANYQAAPQAAGEPPLEWPWYGIGFGAAVKRFFTKYATFSGRASRGEYWWAALFVALVILVFYAIIGIVVATSASSSSSGSAQPSAAYYVVSALFGLVYLGLIIPSIAIAVRRLHDTGRSGAYYFFVFIPFVGGIILLVFLVGQTVPAAEQYGPPYSQAPMPGYGNQGGYQQSYPPQV